MCVSVRVHAFLCACVCMQACVLLLTILTASGKEALMIFVVVHSGGSVW